MGDAWGKNEVWWTLGGVEKTTRRRTKKITRHIKQTNTKNVKKMVVEDNKKEVDNFFLNYK